MRARRFTLGARQLAPLEINCGSSAALVHPAIRSGTPGNATPILMEAPGSGMGDGQMARRARGWAPDLASRGNLSISHPGNQTALKGLAAVAALLAPMPAVA
jgi:hypothetical protein